MQITEDMLPTRLVTNESLVGDRTLEESDVAALLREDIVETHRWVPGIGWIRWNGEKWAETSDQEIHGFVDSWIQDKWRDALMFLADTNEKEPSKKWNAYRKSRAVEAVTKLAQWGLVLDASELDNHPDLLNCSNGVLDLRTGELMPHEPGLFLTQSTGVEYVEGQTNAMWDKVLSAVPADVQLWLQFKFGQAITGYAAPDGVMPILQGGGNNGKSTFVLALRHAIGDYYLVVSHRAILADPTAHTTDLVDFRGKRVAVLEELPEKRLSVVRLKMLNGGTVITARKMRKDNVVFAPSHSMFITTNPYPVVSETDHGTWRRLALVKFPYKFVDGEVSAESAENERKGDPHLEQWVKNTPSNEFKQAALAWAVEGARMFYKNGQIMPPPPACVVEDTNNWRGLTDDVMRFWDEALVVDKDSAITANEMFTVYTKWLLDSNQRPPSQKNFNTTFGDHPRTLQERVIYKQARTNGVNVSSMYSDGVPGNTKLWFGVRFDDDFKSDYQNRIFNAK